MEEPINKNGGFPYDFLQKGYPNKISDEEIKKTEENILKYLRGNAGAFSSIESYISLLKLGQDEINNRVNEKVSKRAHFISVLSLIVSIIALLVTFLSQ